MMTDDDRTERLKRRIKERNPRTTRSSGNNEDLKSRIRRRQNLASENKGDSNTRNPGDIAYEDPLLEEGSSGGSNDDRRLSQLEAALERMDSSHREVKRVERMATSPVYGVLSTAYGAVAGLFGHQPRRLDLYRTLDQHQRDVMRVNAVVKTMVDAYESDLGDITKRLYSSIDMETDVLEGQDELMEHIEKVKHEYIEADETLKALDRSKDARKFNEARKKREDAKSELKRLKSDDRINMIFEIGYKDGVDKLQIQKDTFEDILNEMREFSAQTFMYQHVIDNMTATCKHVEKLSEAASYLSDALGQLEGIKNTVMNRYRRNISNILDRASSDEMGRRAIEDNSELASLRDDLTYAGNERTEGYREQRRLIDDSSRI